MFVFFTVLSVCMTLTQARRVDSTTSNVLQRTDYGVIFQEQADLMLAQEYWLHTFHVPLPIRFSIIKVPFCSIENTQQITSCLLLNNLANFIHELHEETLGKLNKTKLSEMTVSLVLYYLLLDLFPKEFLEQQPWMMFIYLLAILMH